MNPAANPKLNETQLLWVLSAIQFTNVLDFLIMMPLGPQYMRVFGIGPGQFGLMVSAYAISASISGVVAGLFLDRFDRKSALLILYFGFAVGTFLCAIANTYPLLTAARVVAGAFGGVCGATILAIVGDVVPEVRRGAAMGMVMSAFSLASIAGVPAGLFLANHFSWHAPFYLLAGVSIIILFGACRVLPSLRTHVQLSVTHRPLLQMRALLTESNHIRAFVLMFLLTSAGFFVIPYIAAYMVKNVGLAETQLPFIYFFGGLFTIFSMNIIGKMADRYGKLKIYAVMALISTVPTLAVTRLGHTSVTIAVTVTTLLMIFQSGRFVPAMAIIVSSVQHRYRGGFMSLNSSVQQMASGAATFLSGLILGESQPNGPMVHFGIAGIISAVLAVVGIFVACTIKPATHPDPEIPVTVVPGAD